MVKIDNPVVIIKLDDLTSQQSGLDRFKMVADLIVKKEAKASFGILGISCEDNNDNQSYYDTVKAFDKSGGIEIWHHGYDHSEFGNGVYEFSGTDYAFQDSHIRRTMKLLYEKCGITLHSFGAPFNRNDASTVDILNRNPQIKVWLFPKQASDSNKVLLTERVDMEPAVGHVDYCFFRDNYYQNCNKPYMVLQGHPKAWDSKSFTDFSRILDFLNLMGVNFMTPYEFGHVS